MMQSKELFEATIRYAKTFFHDYYSCYWYHAWSS
jgi:hypothetical protein